MDATFRSSGYAVYGRTLRHNEPAEVAIAGAYGWATAERMEFAPGGEPEVITRQLIRGCEVTVRFVRMVARPCAPLLLPAPAATEAA